jgi:hypothetical protein
VLRFATEPLLGLAVLRQSNLERYVAAEVLIARDEQPFELLPQIRQLA